MKIVIWAASTLAVVFIAWFAGATGAGLVTGRVLDAQSQLPVSGASVILEGTHFAVRTARDGTFTILGVPAGTYILRVESFSVVAAKQQVVVIAGKTTHIDIRTSLPVVKDTEARRVDHKRAPAELNAGPARSEAVADALESSKFCATPPAACLVAPQSWPSPGSESYDYIKDNGWFSALDRPLSTFSVDVDAASYSNVRRFLTQGQLPPVDAVRVEELVNYFEYDYANPRGRHPFSITTEVAACPWNSNNVLVHVGLQGERISVEELPPSNLVFLIDVSGSMNQPNKLPLLKSSFRMLVDQLRAEDRVAIVVYAGAAGLVLPSTCGNDKERIVCAIDQLEAGGSTAGGAGIRLAYQIAQQSFVEDGNNRVILATDGDFNVGVSSDAEMIRLIEEKRRTGVFLTVLGFGEGNLQDAKMEKIADHGNGHYAYIDDIVEAKKVMVNEMGATLLTIAKDVKLQVEFNPARVASYRLVGYENRLLQDRDFDDDTKDAGEIGAGHSVTALYEVTLAGREKDGVRPLKYSGRTVRDDARKSGELLTVSFRYKRPSESESQLLSVVVKGSEKRFANASDDFRFSAAVALFGMILRDSPYAGEASMRDVIAIASGSCGEDPHGYRAEFVTLAQTAEALKTPAVGLR